MGLVLKFITGRYIKKVCWNAFQLIKTTVFSNFKPTINDFNGNS